MKLVSRTTNIQIDAVEQNQTITVTVVTDLATNTETEFRVAIFHRLTGETYTHHFISLSALHRHLQQAYNIDSVWTRIIYLIFGVNGGTNTIHCSGQARIEHVINVNSGTITIK